MARPTLPLLPKVGLYDLGCLRRAAVNQDQPRGAPPHVRRNVRVTRGEPEQQIGLPLLLARGHLPAADDHADHAAVFLYCVVRIPAGEVVHVDKRQHGQVLLLSGPRRG